MYSSTIIESSNLEDCIHDRWGTAPGCYEDKAGCVVCNALHSSGRGKEEVVEDKTTFLDALKGLEATRKYLHKFGTGDNINVMCKKAENKLYILRAKGDKMCMEMYE
jgi:hypothetical protein